MRYDPDGPAVILSPHLDDAALSAFTEIGPNTIVVTVFTGVPEPGTLTIWDKLSGFTDSHEAAIARLMEDKIAMMEAGALSLIHLGYVDSLNRTGPPPDPLNVAARLDGYIERTSALFAPLAGGPKAHPDHRIVRAAAMATAPDIPLKLYADVPYCVKPEGWPVALGGKAKNPPWLNRVARELPAVAGLLDVRVRVLTKAEQKRKIGVCRLYVSQFETLDKKLRTKGLLSRPETWSKEVYVPV